MHGGIWATLSGCSVSSVVSFLTDALNDGVGWIFKSGSVAMQVGRSASEVKDAVPDVWWQVQAKLGYWGRGRNWLLTAEAGSRDVAAVEVLWLNLVAHLELGTELPVDLLWAGCVSSWGLEMIENTEEHL